MISIEEFIKPLCLSWCWDNHNWNRLVRSLLAFLFLWLSHEDGQKHQDWFGVYRCIRGCDRFDLSLHQSKEFKKSWLSNSALCLYLILSVTVIPLPWPLQSSLSTLYPTVSTSMFVQWSGAKFLWLLQSWSFVLKNHSEFVNLAQ